MEDLRHKTRLANEMNAQACMVLSFYTSSTNSHHPKNYSVCLGHDDYNPYRSIMNEQYALFMETINELNHDGNKALALQHTRKVFDNAEITTNELESSQVYATHLKELRIRMRVANRYNAHAHMKAVHMSLLKYKKVLSSSHHHLILRNEGIDDKIVMNMRQKYEEYMIELIELTDPGNKALLHMNASK